MSRVYDPALNDIEPDFARLIHHWCRQSALQDSDAEDVSQTVLLKVIQALRGRRFQGSRSGFRAWLKTITSNTIRDLQRSWKSPVRGTGGTGVESVGHVEDPKVSSSPLSWIEQDHNRNVLATAQHRIRQRVRARTWKVFQMCAIDAVPAKEVARRMNIEPRDVYTIKSRITSQLRREVCRLDRECLL